MSTPRRYIIRPPASLAAAAQPPQQLMKLRTCLENATLACWQARFRRAFLRARRFCIRRSGSISGRTST